MEKNTFKKGGSEPRDFKERFEFRLTVNNIIFCQRYFKINNFNPNCLRSFDLTDAIKSIAKVIDRDLKLKTLTYLELYSPRIFDTEEDMFNYFSKGYDHTYDMVLGHSILIKDPKAPNYYWGDDNKPHACENRFEDKELTMPIMENEVITYKFSFLDNGREVCSTVWDGYYPKMVRNSIDLSNKKMKIELTNSNKTVYQMGFEEYIKYKMFEDKTDLIYNIIKDICKVCCQDNDWYTTEDTYGGNKKGKKVKYVNPKLDNESVEKDLNKYFAKFYK